MFRNLAGGQWQPSSHYEPVDTPIDGSVIGFVPESTPQEVAAAVDAAFHARRAIRALPGHRRVEIFEAAARLLLDHRAVFEEALLLEAGKPAHDRHAETGATAERLRATHLEATHIYGEYLPGDWAADTVGKMALVIREPLGVVACIGPFNYPLFIPAAKVIPALLAGNTVVAKGSHQTPISLLLLARILQEAGLPSGTLNVVSGSGSSTGQALVTDPRIRLVTFTGSTQIGKRIHATAGLKKFHLELGGKCHALVLEDADVQAAAAKCVEGAFKNAGQRCDAVSIVIVPEALVGEFAEAATKAVTAWKAGDPRHAETRLGPLINDEAAERVTGLLRDAESKGARRLAGGEREGRVLHPALLTGVTSQMRIFDEETFGPVLPIVAARNEEEVLHLASQTRFGLDACVFGRSFDRLWRAAKAVECGEVTLNDLPRHGVGHFPFGGQRESGIGREGIGYSIEEMTELKTVVFTLAPRK